ncbi:MAG: rod shape-determining protein MreC [Opitutales bacterium]
MPRLRREQIKPLAWLAAFLVAWILVPPFFKRFVRSALYEFQAPAVAASSHLNDLQAYWSLRGESNDALLETIRDLSRINRAYAFRLNENQSLHAQLERLEEALDLPREPTYRYELARVARRDIDAWWQGLILRKGANYEIPVGAAVIFEGGVVGRVTEVRLYTCVVELVSSPSFRMAANFVGDSRPVTYNGSTQTPMGAPVGRVNDVPPDIQPGTEPLELVSSSLGGVFPQGLTIGTVERLEIGANGLFQRGPVILSEELRSLREVAILLPEGIEEPIQAPEATP